MAAAANNIEETINHNGDVIVSGDDINQFGERFENFLTNIGLHHISPIWIYRDGENRDNNLMIKYIYHNLHTILNKYIVTGRVCNSIQFPNIFTNLFVFKMHFENAQEVVIHKRYGTVAQEDVIADPRHTHHTISCVNFPTFDSMFQNKNVRYLPNPSTIRIKYDIYELEPSDPNFT